MNSLRMLVTHLNNGAVSATMMRKLVITIFVTTRAMKFELNGYRVGEIFVVFHFTENKLDDASQRPHMRRVRNFVSSSMCDIMNKDHVELIQCLSIRKR